MKKQKTSRKRIIYHVLVFGFGLVDAVPVNLDVDEFF